MTEMLTDVAQAADRRVLNAGDRALWEAALGVTGRVAAITEQRDAAMATASAETVRADAETVRANAAEDRVRELEALLLAERGHTAYWHARADEAEETLRCEAATLELPRYLPEPAPKRRGRWRR